MLQNMHKKLILKIGWNLYYNNLDAFLSIHNIKIRRWTNINEKY